MKTKTPTLTSEIFVIPLEDKKYLIYAPLRRAAFVGNAATVNFLADLKSGHYSAASDPCGAVAAALQQPSHDV
jgi:hypothetical protein